MRNHFLFGTLALLVGSLLAANAASKDDYHLLLQDDFSGTALNSLNWTARRALDADAGSSVAVANGVVTVSQDQSDNGGFLTSRPLTFASTGLITIRERVYVHAYPGGTAETFVYGGTSLGNGSWQFGAKHINITDPMHIFYPQNINAFTFGDNDIATTLGVSAGGYGGGNNFGQVRAIWDAWFDEEMTLDPATSMVTYSVNGGPKVTGTLTAPMPQGPLTLTFNAFGWWTGHYEMIDSVSVVQAVPVDFVPTVSIAVSKVKVTQHVGVGRNYVLEASTDLVNWTATGPQFTAASETIVNEFDVDLTGRFFRIRQVP